MATKNIPNLFLHTPLFVGNPPPDTERPEPYGYPVKEGSFFRPADINSIWDLFVGWHDWAVQLNSELGMLYRIGQSCLQGRDPLTSKDCVDNLHLPSFNPFPERKLSFADTLLAGVPQFMLCVWELTLNGWRPMDPSDAVGRLLLHLRGRRSVQIGRTQYRSAVEAVFRSAFTLAGILEGYSELAAGLAITRRRHARQHTLDPWCWLRWLQEKQQAWIILYMLDQELSNFETSKIITQQKLRCERWRRAARERWMELLPSDPGFDWSVTYSDLINITNISRQIVNALDGYDEASLAEELSNEVEYVSQWLVAQTSPLPRDLGTDLVEIKQDAANGPSELGVAKDSKRADSSLEGGGVPAGAPKPRVDLRDPA